MVGRMIQFLPYGWIQYTDFHWVHHVYCWACSSICGHFGHFHILAFVDEKHKSVATSYVPIRISLDIYQARDAMTILRPFPGQPIPQIVFYFSCLVALLAHIASDIFTSSQALTASYLLHSYQLLSLWILKKP